MNFLFSAGITQEQVDNGIPLGACLYMFSTWIRKMSEEYKVTFNANVSGKRATFATWSGKSASDYVI